ncbi:MAG: hypothetical protein IKS45_13250, partial [Thermoguttaceae bacterium]|nr:hypothetical protein [Thermoguttaceae bacterium]
MSDKNTQNDKQNKNDSKDPKKDSTKWGYYSLPIWITLIVVGIVIAAYFIQSDARRTYTVPYMDFVKLVEQGAPEKNPKAQQVYTEKRGEQTCQYRVSNISELKVGSTRITGKGDFIKVSEDGKPVQGELFKDIGLKHSWERLLVDILSCLQWFNPAIWMLRADLQ